MNIEYARAIGRQKMKGLGIGDIGPFALAIGVAVIIVAVVAMILATMKDNVTEGNATAIIQKGLTAMSNFGDWFGLIVVVGVAVIILGLVLLLRGQERGGA